MTNVKKFFQKYWYYVVIIIVAVVIAFTVFSNYDITSSYTSAPTGVTAYVDNDAICVEWDAVYDAYEYLIYVETDEGWIEYSVPNSKTKFRTDWIYGRELKLLKGHVYSVKIRSVDFMSDKSKWSESIEVTV